MELETAHVERTLGQEQAQALQNAALPESGDRRFDPGGSDQVPDSGDIPVAVAVQEGEATQPSDLPRATEQQIYSDDNIATSRKYRHIIPFLLVFAVVGSVVLGLVFQGNDDAGSVEDDDARIREGLGIREEIEEHFPDVDLDSEPSPYKKALDWVTYEDLTKPHPDDENFMQRYTLAYFYFATTERGQWKSCNPPNAEAGEDMYCVFVYSDVQSSHGTFHQHNRRRPSIRWLSESDECDWAGIFCDRSKGEEVLELQLVDVGLSGSFPEGVVHLSTLEILALSLGDLTGPLSPELVKMSDLSRVEIGHNVFTGEIPPEWWRASNWQYLDVASNNLEGTIPGEVSSLESMKLLYLHDNMFEGKIPTEIGLLNLTGASLFNNAFRGPLPSSMMTPTIKQLWLKGNLFTGAIPTDVARMVNMVDLVISFNQLSGSLIDEIYQMPLQRLDVRSSNLSGTLSHLVGNFGAILQLYLSDNMFSGKLPEEFGLCTDLYRLWIQGNDFTGTIPHAICSDSEENRNFAADCLSTSSTTTIGGESEGTVLEPLVICPGECCNTCCDQNGFCRDGGSGND